MLISGRYGNHATQESGAAGAQHLDWRVAVCNRVVPKLAVLIESPVPDRAVRPECHGVRLPTGNRNHAAENSAAAAPQNLHWRRAVHRRVVPELAVAVRAPCPHSAVCHERHRVIGVALARNRNHGIGRRQYLWRRRLNATRHRRHDAIDSLPIAQSREGVGRRYSGYLRAIRSSHARSRSIIQTVGTGS